MSRHLLIGVLIGLVASSGCGGSRLIVRTVRGEKLKVDQSKVHRVEYEKEDLREALEGPYANVMAQLIRQHDGQLRIHLASTVIPSADAADVAFVEEYLSWCEVTRGERGDCVSARDPKMPSLTVDGKRGIALRMAFSSAMNEAAEVIRGIDPMKIEAMMLMWFAFYLASFVIPEPVTKLLDIIMTANLIAFIGVDGFHNVIEGYLNMRKDAADAKDFAALHEAGLRYGRRLGPSMLRIVTALITLGLAAKAGAGTAATELPGGEIAATNAQGMGFNLATISGGSVTLSTSATVTLVVQSAVSNPMPVQGGEGTGAAQTGPSVKTKRNLFQDLLGIKQQKGLGDLDPGTRAEAEAIGRAWVNGKNVSRFELESGGYGLTDGVRTFRLQYKPRLGSWQANFQENAFVPGRATGVQVKNVHMRITDMGTP